MKRKMIGILTIVMLTSLTGCSGAQAQATNANNVTEVSATTESADIPIESTTTEETSSIPESEVEPVYIDYEDLYLADNYLKVDREKLEAVDTDSLEETYEDYVLSESVDLYNFEGTWVGYSKPDIRVTLFGTNDKWAEVSFTKMILYVPKMNFDLVAMTPVEESETEEALLAKVEETTPKQEITPSKPKTETPAPVTTEPVVVEPSTTELVVAEPEPVAIESNKYTPEEAVAVYRSIMEANGIQWDPSIKEFASWGTGWIYLDKGEAERGAQNSVEAFRRGGGDATHPWTKFYIEVSGYDENAVYITGWNCD